MKAKHFAYNTSAVSAEQFAQHVKLYNGYVEKVNEITADLKTAPQIGNATYSLYRGLKVAEPYALDGVILHELYFENMTKQISVPEAKTTELLHRFYGSVQDWEADFRACAMSARGWCVTVYEQRTNSIRTILQDTHDTGVVCAAYPLIVLDMYEHAYFLDYGIQKGEYITAFLKSIDWACVEKRVENCKR